MPEYIILCASGCGEGGTDIETYQAPEALKEGDKTLYCKGCNGDIWFVIPVEGDDLE